MKLKYDKLLSSFAFNFNLRRYTKANRFGPSSSKAGPDIVYDTDQGMVKTLRRSVMESPLRQGLTLVHFSTQRKLFLLAARPLY